MSTSRNEGHKEDLFWVKVTGTEGGKGGEGSDLTLAKK